MHRRTLILRRFGELSFGLGYVEDGVWVDHAMAIERGEDLLTNASAADRAGLEAMHAWFACCDGEVGDSEVGDSEVGEGRALVAIGGSASS
jgi:hypothetical protein